MDVKTAESASCNPRRASLTATTGALSDLRHLGGHSSVESNMWLPVLDCLPEYKEQSSCLQSSSGVQALSRTKCGVPLPPDSAAPPLGIILEAHSWQIRPALLQASASRKRWKLVVADAQLPRLPSLSPGPKPPFFDQRSSRRVLKHELRVLSACQAAVG